MRLTPMRNYGLHQGFLGVDPLGVVFFGLLGLRGGIAPPSRGFFGIHSHLLADMDKSVRPWLAERPALSFSAPSSLTPPAIHPTGQGVLTDQRSRFGALRGAEHP